MKISLKIFISIIAVLIIGFFVGQYFAKIGVSPREIEVEQEIKISLLLDFSEGNIKNFENIRLSGEETVFDLLKKVTEENNLEFSFKEYPDLGVFVESIDNMGSDPKSNKWWQYWVNNEYAQLEAGSFFLEDGDTVEWKYIESQF
ncbi:DUF4430 domain-containing protein [Patescibacteria group bacterium]|nr:DUF4430 domain-containing protein [Patescibacteria group bacterium]